MTLDTLPKAIDTFKKALRLLISRNPPNTIPLPLNGRGLPLKFEQALRAQDHQNTSGHAQLEREEALVTLLDSLTIIRQAHKSANTGLDTKIWNNAHLRLSITGLDFEYYRPGISQNRNNQCLCRSATFAEVMAAHQKLDLSGPTRIFRMANLRDSALPYLVAAPSPEMAIKRLNALTSDAPKSWSSPLIYEELPSSLYEDIT